VSNYQSEMQKLVEDFVGRLSNLYRDAVIDALSSNGNGHRNGYSNGNGNRRKGEKRPADELKALSDKFVAFVAKNPGLRIEQINTQLGTSTQELALPIRKLIAEGVIRGKGEKRSTAYFAKG
jgi:predicted HTH transcriptional regulator